MKKCLKKIPRDNPFRGLEEFENEKLKYINKIGRNRGELEFSGKEEIFLKAMIKLRYQFIDSYTTAVM